MPKLSISSLFPFRRTKVVDTTVRQGEVNSQATAVLEPDQRFNPICHYCQAVATGVHSSHQRELRDLALGQYETRVRLHYRKIECPRCGRVRVEELGVADTGGPRVTRRLARYVQGLCKLMTVLDVARHLDLDPKTVKQLDQQALEIEFGKTDYTGLKHLAIDEISRGRYHDYLTIIIDFDTGRVVWVGKGRKAETLTPFFEAMPDEVKKQIEAVAMDMWEPYINAVKQHLPAAAIVFDLFHIVKNYSHVIDQVRRGEWRRAREEDKRFIKGSRWLLLKNPENLSEKERPRLQEVLAANENLSKVYILKDALKAIWESRDRQEMAQLLDAWCEQATEAALRPLDKFVKMLQSHRDGILNHANCPIHTGKLEGLNNKIKVLKRRAYGYHDDHYFALKIKQASMGTT